MPYEPSWARPSHVHNAVHEVQMPRCRHEEGLRSETMLVLEGPYASVVLPATALARKATKSGLELRSTHMLDSSRILRS